MNADELLLSTCVVTCGNAYWKRYPKPSCGVIELIVAASRGGGYLTSALNVTGVSHGVMYWKRYSFKILAKEKNSG